MVCAGAQWCDFISFDPRVAEEYRMFTFRLHLDEAEATTMLERVKLAVTYMDQLKKEIEAAKPKLLLG